MATTSQKMMEMRFLVRIRGARTPPPTIEDPVMKMPLERKICQCPGSSQAPEGYPYHAAPTTDRPMHSEMPKLAQAVGDTDSRKAPT